MNDNLGTIALVAIVAIVAVVGLLLLYFSQRHAHATPCSCHGCQGHGTVIIRQSSEDSAAAAVDNHVADRHGPHDCTADCGQQIDAAVGQHAADPGAHPHGHSQYSVDGHQHPLDPRYATADHRHDSRYARLRHSHVGEHVRFNWIAAIIGAIVGGLGGWLLLTTIRAHEFLYAGKSGTTEHFYQAVDHVWPFQVLWVALFAFIVGMLAGGAWPMVRRNEEDEEA